ncbi:MAG: hypothetical protein ABDK94_07865 [Atribacterota bacterium]
MTRLLDPVATCDLVWLKHRLPKPPFFSKVTMVPQKERAAGIQGHSENVVVKQRETVLTCFSLKGQPNALCIHQRCHSSFTPFSSIPGI